MYNLLFGEPEERIKLFSDIEAEVQEHYSGMFGKELVNGKPEIKILNNYIYLTVTALNLHTS